MILNSTLDLDNEIGFHNKVTCDIELVVVGDIKVDPRVNTKAISAKWVEDRVDKFDPHKLGVLTISARPDGTYVCLDGQHRRMLLKRAGWTHKKIKAMVYRGLTIDQEAQIFLGLNDNRRVNAFPKFMANITAGDPVTVEIKRIVENFNWIIENRTGDGRISATRSLENIAKGAGARNRTVNGYIALAKALQVITEAWGYRHDAGQGDILQGIGMVFNRYGNRIDTDHLTQRLMNITNGATGLLVEARGRRRNYGARMVSVAQCVAETVVDLYNNRLSTNRIPDWRDA